MFVQRGCSQECVAWLDPGRPIFLETAFSLSASATSYLPVQFVWSDDNRSVMYQFVCVHARTLFSRIHSILTNTKFFYFVTELRINSINCERGITIQLQSVHYVCQSLASCQFASIPCRRLFMGQSRNAPIRAPFIPLIGHCFGCVPRLITL